MPVLGQAAIYLFKVNNWNRRTMCEIYLKLTINTEEPCHWHDSGVFVVNFEQISHIVLLFPLLALNIVTRNKILWKIARGYCLCYCKTFLLERGSTECKKKFLPKCAVHYLYHLKSNNIVSQRKTTNTEKHFYLKTFSYIANTCK